MNKWLVIFLFSTSSLFSYEKFLTVCMIFQNEARFLDEWIQYHNKNGVDHFILYNNLSEDNYKEVLNPYIKSGLVELVEWPFKQEGKNFEAFVDFCFKIVVDAYNDGIKRCKGKSKWIAFIDSDEFLVPVRYKNLKDLLKKHKDLPAIGLQWVLFGTSNVPYTKSGELLDKLRWRLPLDHPRNDWFKSIVKSKAVKNAINPHCMIVQHGPEKILDRAEARINHYWTRDEDHLHKVKIPRYTRWGQDPAQYLLMAGDMNQEYDNLILKFR